MSSWNDVLLGQFDAAIETLRAGIEATPEAVWHAPCGRGELWLTAFHAIYFLDLYLSESLAAHEPPAPFTNSEREEDALPPRVYTREELLGYLDFARAKCRARCAELTPQDLERPSGFEWLARRGLSVAETMLYNLRHVQHHAAQINLVLRQREGFGAAWVFGGSAS